MSGSSIAEHKAEFLKPSQLFLETMKGDYYNPVFLGFSFTDKHVRLAISDDCNANTYWDAYKFGPSRSELPRNDDLLNRLVDILQCLKDDTVEKYHLLGVVVVDNSVVMKLDIHDLMDNLCKKGNFGILKYTCWKDNIATDNPTFVCNRFGSLFWGVTFPVERSELRKHQEVMSAEQMLQGFLDFFDTIYYMDKDEEMVDEDRVREDKDEVREDKGLEMEDSERKMIKYQKSLQFFQEIMKRDSYIPVFLGLSFTDVFAVVALSDPCLNAHTFGRIPKGKDLLDNLVGIIRFLQNDHVQKLVGIIVAGDSVNPTFVSIRFGSLFGGVTFPVERSELRKHQEVISAEQMLQRFLDFSRALYIDKDEKVEDS
ncbi:hypothetical protein EZV62_013099 [Acer yangbiense]|uniref:Uncharacterized protein n=1 Tax=Acer yangbiense TaxID=1000413 RepID=A0A5C7HZC5_9ROSI|nr:hypothetical protein EZV62_013099 [Acer yangbiense]